MSYCGPIPAVRLHARNCSLLSLVCLAGLLDLVPVLLVLFLCLGVKVMVLYTTGKRKYVCKKKKKSKPTVKGKRREAWWRKVGRNL